MKNQISFKIFVMGAAVLTLAACGGNTATKDGDEGLNSLLDIVAVSAGDMCTEGGYTINAGVDLNANGILDADEVTSSSTSCNGEQGTAGDDGTDGFESLVEQTELPMGDENCSGSGVRLDVGIDNGDGDGTADDGILQAGEVDDSTFVCNSVNFVIAKPVTPPEGPVGAFTIVMNGGEGSTGNGGDGGYVDIKMPYGTLGGHNKIFNTGVADASFEMPATVHTYLGDNPLVVSADLTIKSYNNDNDVIDGEAHTHINDDSAVYIWDDDAGADIVVTGIKIEAGVTLTIDPNIGGLTGVEFDLENDFHNAGILETGMIDSSHDRSSCQIGMDTYYGEANSLIVMSGADGDSTDADGGNGGLLSLRAKDSNHNTENSGGLVVNYSLVDTTGGDGESGGNGGNISIEANLSLHNAGDMDGSGGVASTGDGGLAGYVEIWGHNGSCYNSGRLKSNGGAGALNGGSGTAVSIYVEGPGEVRNTGELSTNGGNVDEACTGACVAGSAGYVEFYVGGGDMINNASITARGGASIAGEAGAGGYLELGASPYGGWNSADGAQPAGDFIISGNIDLSGGDGAVGAAGGYVSAAFSEDIWVPLQQEIIFLGYTDIYADGGNGAVDGGTGGHLKMHNERAEPDYGEYGPGGGNINYANLHADGGTGETGIGGDGGYFEMDGDDYYGALTDGLVALNYGDITINAGDSAAGSSWAGWFLMWGYNRAENYGDISMKGGNSSADNTTVYSSDYGLGIFSDLGPAINTGDVDMSGGLASGANSTGGKGSIFELVGYSAMNSGAITVKGGNSTGTDGVGGAANDIFIYGVFEGSTNTGTFNIDAGTGATLGAHGEVVIDGMNMTDSWYTP